jgi:hypothetical protein
VVSLVVFFFFAGFLYVSSDIMPTHSLELFTFVPNHVVHWLGIAIMCLVALAGLAGMVSMARGMARKEHVTWSSLVQDASARKRTLKALWYAVGIESIGQRRYRVDCKDDRPAEPWYRRRWFIHALTIWGFLGLLVATSLDYGLDVVGVKKTGTPIPLWYPSRLIGTIGGLMLMYGVTMFAVNRWQKYNRAATVSAPADWTFLVLLWVTGLTGFMIEVALYLPPTPVWGYWVFLVHVAIAMELLLFIPFTKFAHVIYRPVALFFYSLAAQPIEPRS